MITSELYIHYISNYTCSSPVIGIPYLLRAFPHRVKGRETCASLFTRPSGLTKRTFSFDYKFQNLPEKNNTGKWVDHERL